MGDENERAKQQREFQEGLDNIRKAFLDAAKAADVKAELAHLRLEPEWRPGRSIPEHVRMTLAAPGAPLMAIDLSRAQVEDSWRSLERPELRQMMREVTSRFKRMKEGKAEPLMSTAPLNDTILIAVAQLVDDAQTGQRRDPSHYDIGSVIERAGLRVGDPASQGMQIGKTKRVRAVLNYALENDPESGGRFVYSFIAAIRGHGGFRPTSPNYVGQDAIESAASAFASEGYVLTSDGELRPAVLDSLSGQSLTDALMGYVRRAKRGSADAALLVGTGKDLLEAVCGHIMQERVGYVPTSNFPTLLGQLFIELGLATPQDKPAPSEPANRRVERATYELACSLNALRNKEGTGHGHPWLPGVTEAESRMAIESMGVIAERLLAAHFAKRR